MMLYLGDVYDNGTIAEFYNWYGEATHQWFDRFKSITNPVIGNHEYESLLGPEPLGYAATGEPALRTCTPSTSRAGT